MKRSLILLPALLAAALVLCGCSRNKTDETKDADSPSAKASSQALTNGMSDGTGKVYTKEQASKAGGPAPKVNPEAQLPKVAGEDAGPGTKATPVNPTQIPTAPPAPPANASAKPSPTPSAETMIRQRRAWGHSPPFQDNFSPRLWNLPRGDGTI
jgi:hypothetical protein